MNKEIIFYTLVDDKIIDFVQLNSPLQKISNEYQLISMCSGVKSPAIIEALYNSKIIMSHNDMGYKGRLLMEHLQSTKNNEFILIKIDMDALITNPNKLIEKIKNNIEPISLIGNMAKARRIKEYIRGGCNAMHSDLVYKLRIKGRGRFYDNYIHCAVKKIPDHKIINCPLFEIGEYKGELPVWHPPKLNRNIKSLMEKIKLYKEVLGEIR